MNQCQHMVQNILPSIPVSTPSTGIGCVKKHITIAKSPLPTVKLAPNINPSGPPPLTSVNNGNINAATTVGNSSANSQILSATEATKKEELSKIPSTQQQTTATAAQVFIQTTSEAKALSTQTVQNTTTSTATSATSASNAAAATTHNLQQSTQNSTQVPLQSPQTTAPSAVPSTQQTQQVSPIDVHWLYICDWRNCPRKKFKSMGDLQHHVCTSHAPDHLDPAADIFCQWGVGPGLCDGLPRKRFSLMTHLIDHHLTLDSLRAAVQRRIATGFYNIAPVKPPVTIVRNTELVQRANNASPGPSTSSSPSSQNTTCLSALQAIQRHTDFTNSKELMDENEGPVTKSIRLTASLILRNLVTYTAVAKRSVRRYESHLANIALSNVESSGTISNILYEMNV